ncbi:MAG: 16S rRNA (guanine(527)-N(7))-methyltransferase RsmG [Gammaproteobacteria bacterium]
MLRERLDDGLAAMALALAAPARVQLVEYLLLLERWNRAFNLVAQSDASSMVERHILDCLAPLPWLDAHAPADAAALDLGTGAGLPGLVLAIARPRLQWTLLDANGKKARFCRQAAAALDLKQVRVEQGRAERHRSPGGYDLVISRAVADLPRLAGLAHPMLAVGGWIVAMTGRTVDVQEPAFASFGLAYNAVELRVPGADERHLMVMGRVD